MPNKNYKIISVYHILIHLFDLLNHISNTHNNFERMQTHHLNLASTI